MTYYMTRFNPSEIGYYEPCTATTLRGAKAEATRELGHGFIGDKLIIAVGDNVTAPRVEVAMRINSPGTKWEDIAY